MSETASERPYGISTAIHEPIVGDYQCKCGWRGNSEDAESIQRHHAVYCELGDDAVVCYYTCWQCGWKCNEDDYESIGNHIHSHSGDRQLVGDVCEVVDTAQLGY